MDEPDANAGPDDNGEDTWVEGLDFYFDGGLMVLTRRYLLRRGTCCESGCRHCPYGFGDGSE